MKPKEIIEKLDLAKGVKPRSKKQDQLLDVMLEEIESAYQNFNSEDNARLFDCSVKIVYHKWQSISNKIVRGLSDGLWSYFYASKIVPLKRKLCPTWASEKDKKQDVWEK